MNNFAVVHSNSSISETVRNRTHVRINSFVYNDRYYYLPEYRPFLLGHPIVQRMHIACLITKATKRHSNIYYFLLLHGYKGYANASQCYLIRTSPFLGVLGTGESTEQYLELQYIGTAAVFTLISPVFEGYC